MLVSLKDFWPKLRKNVLRRRQPFTTFNWRFLLPGQSRGVRIHRYVFFNMHRNYPRSLRVLAAVYNLGRWWLYFAIREVIIVYKAGNKTCSEKYEIAKSRQIIDLFAITFAYCIPAWEYYQSRLHQWPRSQWLDFAYDFQATAWHEALAYENSRQSHELLNNKAQTEQFLTRHNLSALTALKLNEADAEIIEEDIEKFPDEFFIKPTVGNRSLGCLTIRKHTELEDKILFEFEHFQNSAIFRHKTLEDINKFIGKQEYLVQPVERNHPDLVKLLDTDKLGTIRLVSSNTKDGIFAQTAVLEAPVKYKPAVYWNAAIDIDSGELLEPTNKNILDNEDFKDWFDKVKGKTFPSWSDLKSLCLAAHAKLPEFLTIGWDMALTQSGPKIVEGNICWGLKQYQQVMQVPLLQTRIGSMYFDFISKSSGLE